MAQAHVLYCGRVQGVGFRFTARAMAIRFAVGGWVRNLSDGRVELLATGTRSEVEQFLNALAQELAVYIREQHCEWSTSESPHQGFVIRT